ncbi:DUF92 domain-containing protein [filamentous cyanobacterium LEGE 11480]|uniref:DUF92 domain-containing protein n=1 Tax=Romeriopsis navalis LEGE 11480 TaxID=2777977 RepID=A0A928VUX3_9CYAN|nr:DUF92 domain-containing protein [Romeriopsis navalis]MBE9032977.1 DUF92 domain-containing protein [Romeriopsis navalis LEGE 11480]
MLIPDSFAQPWLVGAIINAVLLTPLLFIRKKLLTPAGVLHAWILGTLLWGSFKSPSVPWYWLPGGYVVMVVYFILGSGVTKVGAAEKEALGIAEARSGARGPENVWGSALISAICAVAFWIVKVRETQEALLTNQVSPWYFQAIPLLLLAYVAAISTKLADTCGTEIGKAYGKRTFLITTLKPVPRGTEGAVSLEGTIAGIVGAAILASIAWGVGLIPYQLPIGILFVVIAAFIATNIESLIGATIEGKIPGLNHDVVNILNTLIGAIVAVGLAYVVGYNPMG